MSIEFNRRTFLKTTAALIGGGVLVGLTGCDSSSSASHSINKKVGNNTYNVGGVIVDPQTGVSYVSSSGYEFYLNLTNNTDADIPIYPSNFDATYKNTSAPLDVADENDATLNCFTLTAKTATAAASTSELCLTIPKIGAVAQDANDCVFLFSYNGKSIAFQNKNGELYTSGVFSDKIKF